MNWYEVMAVDLPECELDGLRIERFTIGPHDVFNFKLVRRATRPGTYTALRLNGRLWMSDTDAEKSDHFPMLHQVVGRRARRVLINGLGLGAVVKAVLTLDHVEHVDVVEIDKRVIDLVGAHYARDPRVHLHHADAYEQASRWPSGSRWDVGWSDICVDNLASMAKLRRAYGRRTWWHDCWSRAELVRIRDRDRVENRRRETLRRLVFSRM